jgi:hypothetical protein
MKRTIYGNSSIRNDVFVLRDLTPFELGQNELLPLRTKFETPRAYQTADAWGDVVAEDGYSYVIKSNSRSKDVPVSEIIGSCLAVNLDVPCPSWRIIELQTGEICFGSRKIGGIADAVETENYLRNSPSNMSNGSVTGASKALSSIYAFDLLTGNEDRHLGNYIITDLDEKKILYSIDMGHALLWNDKYLSIPDRGTNTRERFFEWSQAHAFDVASIYTMLDKIEKLESRLMTDIFSRVPSDLLPAVDKKNAILHWWNVGRFEKIELIRKGINDGSLL